MTGFSARRLASACAVTAVSAVAFMLPGAATASAACPPTQISGQGSTLQEIAQHSFFVPGFNAKCATEGGEVKEYKGTGSGPGLEAWGNNGHTPEFENWEYVGTDQPPNPTQKATIETAAGGAKVLSIPTLQAAVAVAMHLPKGCTGAESNNKLSKGRFVLDNLTLEKIFKRSITKWSEITEDGDKLVGAGCEKEALITRVVRLEGSGTTAIFKKYLYQMNQAPVDGTKTWNNLAEENKNLDWPEETEHLVRGEGNGGMVKAVDGNYGTIGYINLASARASSCFVTSCEVELEKVKVKVKGGEGGEVFWAFLQDNGVVTKKEKYANPETGGTEAHQGTSNCSDEVYVNGAGAEFPPETTEEAWNEVSATTTEKKYSLCGFTYDLSLVGFHLIPEAVRPTKAQEEVAFNYFKYMVSSTGQKLLKKETDYLGLPTSKTPRLDVLLIAQEGAAKISW